MASGAVSLHQAQAGRDIITGKEIHIYQPAAASSLSPLHQLPPPPAHFTGREEDLAELEKALDSAHMAGATISGKHAGVQGMPGVGKTALATVLAHRVKDKYPDAQICLNLRGFDPAHKNLMSPEEAMQRVIHAFRPEAKLPETAEDLTAIYISVLNEAGRVLLFLDSAVNAEQIRPLLPPPNCLLLVTSRNQFTLPGLATRNIDCLPPEKSQELLLKLAPRIKGHEATAADLCGHLPLALEVFAGVVSEKTLHPVAELVSRLRKHEEKLGKVEASFQVSYDLLEEPLRRGWALLAIFPANFDLRAAAAIWDMKTEASRDIMEALFKESLVQTDEAKIRFRLHDLVRQFCDGKLRGAEREAAMMLYARHYTNVGKETSQFFLEGGINVVHGLELFDRERVHIESTYEWLAPKRDETAASMLISLVDAILYTGQALRFHPRQRICWLERQCVAARITKNRMAEGWALGNLGNAYKDLGKISKAIDFYEQALAIDREIGDRRGEGKSLGNLGIAYAFLGEPQKTIEFCKQALDIGRESCDRLGEGVNVGNLGIAHLALGEPRKAIEFFKQALVIHREIGDRRGEGMALGNLGIGYAALGEPRRAIEFYEQALLIHREIGDRRCEGNDLFNSALVLDELGDRVEAIVRAEAGLKIYGEIEDPNAAKVRALLEKWKEKKTT